LRFAGFGLLAGPQRVEIEAVMAAVEIPPGYLAH
jgi:hypothetical protein